MGVLGYVWFHLLKALFLAFWGFCNFKSFKIVDSLLKPIYFSCSLELQTLELECILPPYVYYRNAFLTSKDW